MLLVQFFYLAWALSALPQESKVGLAVGKLRAHATKSVSDLSKEIVKQWKAAVEKAKNGHTGAFTRQAQNLQTRSSDGRYRSTQEIQCHRHGPSWTEG